MNSFNGKIGQKPQFQEIHGINEKDTLSECANLMFNKVRELHSEGVDYSDIGVLFRKKRLSKIDYPAYTQFISQCERFGVPYVTTETTAYLAFDEFVNDVLLVAGDEEHPNELEKLNIAIEFAYTASVSKAFSKGERELSDISEHINKLREILKANKQFDVILSDTTKYLKDELLPYVWNKTISANKKSDSVFSKLTESELHTMTDNYIASLESLCDSCKDLSEMIESIQLNEPKTNEQIKGRLNISTVHKAKGLEYQCVVGCVDPQKYQNANEEEMRICYVEATRAKEKLYLYAPTYEYTDYRGVNYCYSVPDFCTNSRFIQNTEILPKIDIEQQDELFPF